MIGILVCVVFGIAAIASGDEWGKPIGAIVIYVSPAWPWFLFEGHQDAKKAAERVKRTDASPQSKSDA